MTLKLFQVDAFTDKLFGGNPAAVCPLQSWLNDVQLQQIAAENNLAETAFFVKEDNKYHIRWFTPTVEIELCGHATLAAAFVLFNCLDYKEQIIHFTCRVGDLTVVKETNGFITLNFPADIGKNIAITKEFKDKIHPDIIAITAGRTKYLVELPNEAIIKDYKPDFNALKQIDKQVIITAKGTIVDFVSRFFAPNHGIDEDPVTGSAHCVLVPYWANKLNKTNLEAKQLSARGGYLKCKLVDDRVTMSGNAVLYLVGEIYIA